MTGPPERGFSTQLLVDLVLDPRDPGYEAAAQRRGPDHRRRWYEQPAVAVGCLVIGFLLAAAWVHTNRGAPAAAKVHDRLVQRVRDTQADSDKLAGTQARLDAELAELQKAALQNSAQSGTSALVRDLNRDRLIAGELPATGPGVEVRLAEPKTVAQPSGVPGRGDRTPASGGHILIDRDVRSVVNELWADGAEAVSVNGMRLTPTSAIRFAGDAVLVDFQPVDSPYVIDAIGDPDRLVTSFASSDVASRYQTLAGAKGIGFGFREKGSLSLPASPVTMLRYARVPG